MWIAVLLAFGRSSSESEVLYSSGSSQPGGGLSTSQSVSKSRSASRSGQSASAQSAVRGSEQSVAGGAAFCALASSVAATSLAAAQASVASVAQSLAQSLAASGCCLGLRLACPQRTVPRFEIRSLLVTRSRFQYPDLATIESPNGLECGHLRLSIEHSRDRPNA